MSFTQKLKYNISKCDGCEKHCELGYTSKPATGMKPNDSAFYPTIAGQAIYEFIDQNGRTIKDTSRHSIETVIMQARAISKVCDNYNPDHEFARNFLILMSVWEKAKSK